MEKETKKVYVVFEEKVHVCDSTGNHDCGYIVNVYSDLKKAATAAETLTEISLAKGKRTFKVLEWEVE